MAGQWQRWEPDDQRGIVQVHQEARLNGRKIQAFVCDSNAKGNPKEGLRILETYKNPDGKQEVFFQETKLDPAVYRGLGPQAQKLDQSPESQVLTQFAKALIHPKTKTTMNCAVSTIRKSLSFEHLGGIQRMAR